MPLRYPKSRPVQFLCALGAAVLTAVAAPALAAACTVSTGPTSQVFSSFGDPAQYLLMPNGIFASGSTGWTLENAAVVAGGPGLVAGDGQSVQIGSGGSLTSPVICVGISTPTVRFMSRQPGGPAVTMNAYVQWSDWAGTPHTTYVGWVGGSSAWAPSIALDVTSLPLWQAGSTLPIRIQLVPQGGSPDWYVDDFFLDPYTRG